MQASFTLTVSESKRLIAKAVAAMPEVVRAQREGYLLVGRGSTNAYVVEELTGEPLEKERYVAGQVIRGIACALHDDMRSRPVSFHQASYADRIRRTTCGCSSITLAVWPGSRCMS